MHSLEHLISLPLRRLAETLESCAPAEADLEPAQWLSAVELLTMRLDQSFADLRRNISARVQRLSLVPSTTRWMLARLITMKAWFVASTFR